MRLATRRKLDAAQGALRYFQDNPDPSPAAAESVTQLAALVEEGPALARSRAEQQAWATQARMDRDAIRARIRARLAALARLTVVVARFEGDPVLAIRLPRVARQGRVELVDEARRTIAHVSRWLELFGRYGLEGELLRELELDLQYQEAAEERRVRAEARGAMAAQSLERLADEAHQLVRHLGALQRLRFAAQPGRYAAWQAATAVQWNGTRRPAGETGVTV